MNPDGPNGKPDLLASAKDVRLIFARMDMDDEETVALIARGNTFDKCYWAVSPTYIGPPPEVAPNINTVWKPLSEDRERFEGLDREKGKAKWTATRVDIIFENCSDENFTKFLHFLRLRTYIYLYLHGYF